MNKQSPLTLPAQYWYGRSGAIEHLFYGVFEGGGAKGVAYTGALLAMAESKCWFRAVAGASAGAITAALIASGLPPEAMESMTDKALEFVRTGVWAGLRRLRSTTGYFQSDSLRTWLNGIFKEQAKKGGAIPSADVTFDELYAATGIELNVVATDLSLKTQVIFSHIETPKCAVADAVVASSSIPFAFPSRLLQVADGEEGDRLSYHTIVDGGVWSNFPIHIFEDETFRKSHGREPEQIEPDRVLGFLLQVNKEQAPPRGEEVKFIEAVRTREFRAREWKGDGKTGADIRTGRGAKIGTLMLYPFSFLGKFVGWNAGVDRGRWPTPRSPAARNLVTSINGLLGGTYPPFFGALGFAVVAVGAWQVISFLGIDEFNGLQATDWTDALSYVSRPFAVTLTLLAVAVAILIVFASLLGFMANFLLLRASRRILYGLIATYVAGPGAPEWMAERRNVIALPIPLEVKTLTFGMTDDTRQHLIRSAKQATSDKLETLLSEPSLSSEHNGE